MSEATSLSSAKIAFIGSGAMGEAIIKGILAQGLVSANQLTASDPVDARRDFMSSEYGIVMTADNVAAVDGATIVILCVKPQVLDLVAPGLQGKIDKNALVLSIIAGTSINSLQQMLGQQRIVRTMPNTPAQINMGVNVWMASDQVSDAQNAEAKIILGALGEEIEVHKESYIDMQTGLGGSGPGFVFLIIEAMIDAGVQMGFSRADAQTIVLQTIGGSVELVKQTGLHPAELRNRVTSPGGTTAAGIYELEASGLRTTLTNAVLAAYEKSCALGAVEETAK